MANSIDQHKINQFSANVFHLSQQKDSRFAAKVRNEKLMGEKGFYDRYGATAMVEKTGRFENTPVIDVEHSRRMVTSKEFHWNALVDEKDKLEMLNDPKSQYAQSAAYALARQKDDVIIPAFSGNAYSGKGGATSVPLPDSQKIVAHDGSTTTGVNLNVRTLRATSKLFKENEIDPSLKKYFAYSASQLDSLLGQTEVTSSDFNTVKALVQGEVNSFMGFEFVDSERLEKASANVTYNVANGTYGSGTGSIVVATYNARHCIAWAQDGLLFAIKEDGFARVSEREDLSYATQIYYRTNIGATRMEEEKIVQVICAEV